MARTTKVVSVSMPPDLAQEIDRMAKAAHKKRSEFFRELIDVYRRSRLEEEWRDLQRYGARKAREAGVFTEEDIDRIVFEGRSR